MADLRPGGRLPFLSQEAPTEYPGLRFVWNLIVLVVVLGFLSRMTHYTNQETLFGRLIAWPTLVLTLGMLARDVRLWKSRRSPSKAPEASGSMLAPHWGFLVAVGYFVLMLWVGFGLGTVVFLASSPVLLGQPLKRWWGFLLIGLVTAALFLFLFQLGSGLVLPTGWLFSKGGL